MVATRRADASSSSAITAPCAIAEGLLEEHRFLAHLLRSGAPVPRVFASASGETAIEIGEWTYEVHETPAGIDLYEDAISWTPFRTAAHAHSAGQALARLHLAAQGFQRAAPQAAPARRQLHNLRRARSRRGAGALSRRAPGAGSQCGSARSRSRQALELLAPFHAELRRFCPRCRRSGPTTICTPPISSGAIAGDGAQATAIIDFGLADRTNAVHDLAHAIERNIVEWLALVNRSRAPRGRARPPRSSCRRCSTATNPSARSPLKRPPRSRP